MAGGFIAMHIPDGFLSVPVSAILWLLSAGAIAYALARVRDDLAKKPELRRYLEFGAKAQAQKLMRADRQAAAGAFAFEGCFSEVDLLVSPTTPQAAFAFGETPPDNAGTYTMLANFAGTPAISVPMGRDGRNLPLGLQIMGPADGEAAVLHAAACFETAAGLDMTPSWCSVPDVKGRSSPIVVAGCC